MILAGQPLQTDEDIGVGAAVLAVVEEGDVPTTAHHRQELLEDAGAFGKFKTEDAFVLVRREATSDHIAHVQLGHFIAG